ncbi:MAG: hypothetical protein KI790_18205 [Cyclobacteriaceae bacterium]|nr:hypothetical protein [Cyclobacteriaceae bacterium HetDA_MAG_MS6]
MDVYQDKLRLIQWLASLEDMQIISKIKDLKTQNETDWRTQLTEEQKEDIRTGLKDLEEGRQKPFKEVMKNFG